MRVCLRNPTTTTTIIPGLTLSLPFSHVAIVDVKDHSESLCEVTKPPVMMMLAFVLKGRGGDLLQRPCGGRKMEGRPPIEQGHHHLASRSPLEIAPVSRRLWELRPLGTTLPLHPGKLGFT